MSKNKNIEKAYKSFSKSLSNLVLKTRLTHSQIINMYKK